MKASLIVIFIGLAFFLGGCKRKTPQVIREQKNMKKVASQVQETEELEKQIKEIQQLEEDQLQSEQLEPLEEGPTLPKKSINRNRRD